MMPLLRKGRRQAPTQPSPAAGERVYAIGDIHGRIDLLNSLLDKILGDADATCDGRTFRIIGLGDYVDRGDSSQAVLNRILKLQDEIKKTELLMGNHEDALLGFLEDPLLGRSWIDMGGFQTLASFGIPRPTRLQERDLLAIHGELLDAMSPFLDFVRTMPLMDISGNIIFSHSGVNPERALGKQSKSALLWGHPDALVDIPVPGKCVVHGHHDAAEVIQRPGRICVDTGAYYSGVLTAARLDAAVSFLHT